MNITEIINKLNAIFPFVKVEIIPQISINGFEIKLSWYMHNKHYSYSQLYTEIYFNDKSYLDFVLEHLCKAITSSMYIEVKE